MREANILSFPLCARRLNGERPDQSYSEQLDLFAGAYEKVAAIAFFGLDGMNQDTLLASLTKHSVKTIIDLRSRPVFPRPRFNHKFVTHYFFQRSMNYIEFAMSRHSLHDPQYVERSDGYDPLEQWISSEMLPGITACIVDGLSIESGAVAAFRHCVARRTINLIEVHPRSLF